MKRIKNKADIFWLSFAVVLLIGFAYRIFTKERLSPTSSIERSFAAPDTAYAEYVYAYTNGIISSHDKIKIILTADITDSLERSELLTNDLFDFSPEIKGKLSWEGTNALVFTPDAPLPSGIEYVGTFALKKVYKDIDDKLAEFPLHFKVIKQTFETEEPTLGYPEKTDTRKVAFTGVLYSADIATPAEAEKQLKATQDGKDLKITWVHDANGTTHRYNIEGAERTSSNETVKIICAENTEDEQIIETEIPALGVFKVVKFKVVNEGEQYLSVLFSDPLLENQDYNGMVAIDNNNNNFRFLAIDNELRIYPENTFDREVNVNISGAIRNITAAMMGDDRNEKVDFSDELPAIALLSSGTILPSSANQKVSFKAKAIKSVNIEIVRIYETNVPQFLQTNELNGQSEVKRVGRPVFQRKVSLKKSNASNLKKWNNFQFNISEYIQQEPGAIYQVSFRFGKADVLCECADNDENKDWNLLKQGLSWFADVDDKDYDNVENYYYDDYYEGEGDYYEEYDWKKRNDPCNSAFYNSNPTSVQLNILSSDIGLIAKAGINNQYQIFATNLVTAQIEQGVNIELINYQKQSIAKAVTDAEGKVVFDLGKNIPFLAIASKGKEKAYLKLLDGDALSMSNFEVSGEYIQKGLKGFIYGERGVWRPGDSLFLTFMLDAQNGKVSPNQPIVMELQTPLDQVYTRKVLNKGVDGMYVFKLKTEPDAPTGNWFVNVNVGGVKFSKKIKIEAVKPNRLKINLQFAEKEFYNINKNSIATISSAWMHGAPAANLRATYDVFYGKSVFEAGKKFENFTFEIPGISIDVPESKVFDGALSAQGVATFNPNFNNLKGNLSPAVSAYFRGKVYEKSGDFSTDFTTVTIYPYQTIAGLNIKQDEGRYNYAVNEDIDLDVVSVNPKGEYTSNSALQVSIVKLNWQWWWESTTDGGVTNYMYNDNASEVTSASIPLSRGKGKFSFKLDDKQWGRYLVKVTDPNSGHVTGEIIYVGTPYDYSDKSTYATMLTFSAKKTVYKVGENVEFSFPSEAGGNALVSIENGTSVVKTFWTKTKQGKTDVAFLAASGMAPNIYVNVTLLYPHAYTAKGKPMRLYGVVSVDIEDPATHLEPVISAPESIKPEETYNVIVKETQGKPMTYTLAVVDEGLLDLTKYTLPEIWKSFYAKEALGVKSWDFFDKVINALGSDIGKMFAIGGDDFAKRKAGVKANRFKPVVTFVGPFTIPAGGQTTHKLKMPNYVGSVKIMVVAAKNGAYGTAERTMKVKQDLMVLATLPRVASPNDEFYIPVTIFNYSNVKTVNVSLQTNAIFKPLQGTNLKVNFGTVQEKVVYFKVKVSNETGIANVKIAATAGAASSKDVQELEVRPSNPVTTQIKSYTVKAGSNGVIAYTPFGTKGTNSVYAEFASMPQISTRSLQGYLEKYPHGCLEQVTSAAFPQLFVSNLIEMDSRQKSLADLHIKAAINKLSTYQVASGGFAYWPGAAQVEEWVTSYAGMFLCQAEKQGYYIPSSMLKKWKTSQTKLAQTFLPSSKNQFEHQTQAYRLYSLAYAGAPDLGSMNRLKEYAQLDNQSRWLLVAAYAYAGQTTVANNLRLKCNPNVFESYYYYYTFGSVTRDQAIVLDVLCLLKQKDAAVTMFKKVAQSISADNYNTQDVAMSLLAVSNFAKTFGLGTGVYGNYTNDGAASVNINATQSLVKTLNVSGTNNHQLKVNNTGKSILYVNVVSQGASATPITAAQNNGLKLDIQYVDASNRPVNILQLPQGTEFKAIISVSNISAEPQTRLALTQTLPSGWEFIKLKQNEETSSATYDYKNVRDASASFYFDLARNEKKTFTLTLHASFAGTYYMPPVLCENMYNRKVIAYTAGKTVNVGLR